MVCGYCLNRPQWLTFTSTLRESAETGRSHFQGGKHFWIKYSLFVFPHTFLLLKYYNSYQVFWNRKIWTCDRIKNMLGLIHEKWAEHLLFVFSRYLLPNDIFTLLRKKKGFLVSCLTLNQVVSVENGFEFLVLPILVSYNRLVHKSFCHVEFKKTLLIWFVSWTNPCSWVLSVS